MFIFQFVVSVINCKCPVISLADKYKNAALFFIIRLSQRFHFAVGEIHSFYGKQFWNPTFHSLANLFICLSCMPHGAAKV